MSTFKGKKLKITVYGESHSDVIGVKVEGMPRFFFDGDKLDRFLERRRAKNAVYSTARKETDKPVFYGVKNGIVDGEFSAEIANNNVIGADYENLKGKPRPSHADYAWYKKDGVFDFSGGGRFSGRMTAPLCVAGGVLKQYLESRGVFIDAYISGIGGAKGRSYLDNGFSPDEVLSLSGKNFPCIDGEEGFIKEIENAKKDGDSVGGVIECVITGMPAGVGDSLFDGLEGKISQAVFAVPAVKGVEFGGGFLNARSLGSKMNDALRYENGEVVFTSNLSGGINGGISNGNYISLRVAIKPTPSIAKKQETVDLIKKENCTIKIGGRHDACIVPRAVPAIEAAVAIAIADELI